MFVHPMPHAVRSCLLAALAVSAWSVDAVPAQDDPALQLRVAVDLQRLETQGRTAKPTSWWWDPAAATVTGHIRRQLALVMRVQPGAWDANGWLGGASGLVVAAYPPQVGQQPVQALVLAKPLPGATAPLAAGPNIAIGVLTGRGHMGSMATVFGPGLWAHGAAEAIARLQEAGATQSSAGIVEMRLDLASTLDWCKTLEASGVSYGLDPVLPGWREVHPQLTLSMDAKDGAWRSNGVLTGFDRGLPVHALAPEVAGLARSGQDFTLAVGIAPEALAALVMNSMGRSQNRAVTQTLGMRLDEALKPLTGDLLLMVRQGQALPEAVLVAGVSGDARPLAQALAALWQGQPQDLPGALGAWLVNTPVGPLLLAVNAQRLVLGSSPEVLADLLAGRPGDRPLPAGVCAVVEADLPKIAASGLPLLLGAAGLWRYELAPDPISELRTLLPAMIRQAWSPAGAATIAGLAEGNGDLETVRGNATVRWPAVDRLRLRGALAAVAPDGTDPLLGSDTLFSIHGRIADGQVTATVSVYRKPDGFHVLEDVGTAPIAVEVLAGRLAGLQRLAGAELTALPALAIRERPGIDRRWLPDAALLARHLAPWVLHIRPTADGLTAEEEGMPLGGMTLLGAAAVLVGVEQPAMLRWHAKAERRRQPDPPAPGKVEL